MKLRKTLWSINLLVVLALLAGPIGFGLALPVQASEDGPTRRAIKLNGTDAYVRVMHQPRLNPTGALTLEAWVNPSRIDGCRTVIGKDYRTSYWLGLCDGKIRFYPRGSGSARDGNAVIANGWTHIAVTYDGTTRRYYVNGELDYQSTEANGPLTTNTANLGIGLDPATIGIFFSNYFAGLIDDVRIWGVARTQEEIRLGLRGIDYRAYPTTSSELLYGWPFDGRTADHWNTTGSSAQGDLRFETNGVLPADLTIPLANSPVTLDGICGAGEYGAAERIGLRFLFPPATVYVRYQAEALHVCIEGMELVGGATANLMLDPNHSRDAVAQPDDYRLRISTAGAASVERGDGAGGYSAATLPAGAWSAARSENAPTWDAEFRISPTVLGLTSFAGESRSFGLSAAMLGGPRGPDSWPVLAQTGRPDTWATVAFANRPTTVAVHRFTGRVTDDMGAPLADVEMRLSGITPSGLIATTRTNNSGEYVLSFTGYAPAAFLVEQVDLPGAYSISAAGSDTNPDTTDSGPGSTASSLVYRGAANALYAPGLFVDAFGVPAAPTLDRHYLIVYGAPVQPGDLALLIDAKRRQGFQVETVSTQTIAASVPGRELSEKIRNWLKGRWQAHRPNPVYALLVGNGDVIPTRDVGTEYDIPINSENPLYPFPAPMTDWYYADLDSEWNRDGDNAYGEFLWCRPGTVRDEDPGIRPRIVCPPLDSPERDGPFGTSPGIEDDWLAEISIARLADSSRPGVRNAVAAMVAAEHSASAEKRNALLAGAMWTWEDHTWDPNQERYITRDWDGSRPYGFDSAEFLENTLKPTLAARGIANMTRLYISDSPGGDPSLRPSLQPADYPLTRTTFEQLWAGTHPTTTQRFGLINFSGHGWPTGTTAEQWTTDWNRDRVVHYTIRREDTVPPNACAAPDSNPYCSELTGGVVLSTWLPQPGGLPPLVYANACSTGALGIFCRDALPGENPYGRRICTRGAETMPGLFQRQGWISAWIGALDPIPVGGMDVHHDGFMADLLGNQTLAQGDAFWKHMGLRVRGERVSDWRHSTMTLFGDPAAAYWGNPLDTQAYWPQAGRDWTAASSAPVPGPRSGRVLWSSTAGAPATPPVVDALGNIYVAGSSQIVRLTPDGAVTASLATPDVGPQQPALTTDGLYITTANGLRFADRNLALRQTFSLPAGRTAIRPPLVGPNGVVYLPLDEGLLRVTPGGSRVIATGGPARGVAMTRSGGIVWAAAPASVRLYEETRFGDIRERTLSGVETRTGPAVAADGRIIFAGSSFVTALARDGAFLWSTPLPVLSGETITAGPAVAPNGTVFVGSGAGYVMAVDAGGAVRWRTNIGATIVAAPTTDGQQVFVAAGSRLYALDSISGGLRWSLALGSATNVHSTPVIGPNRTLYVILADGRLVAVGEEMLRLPSDVVVQAGLNALTVNWRDTNLGEAGYLVEACPTGPRCAGQSVIRATLPANTTSVTLGQLPAGQPFFHARVQALAADPAQSSDFAYVRPALPLPPAPISPQGVGAKAGNFGQVEVNWSYNAPREHVLSFEIQRGESNQGPFQPVGSAGPDAALFTDPEAPTGKPLFYRIRARGNGGISGWSALAQVTTRPPTLPPPAGLGGAFAGSSVVLSWQAVPAATGYQVERKFLGVAGWEPLARLPASETTFRDINLPMREQVEYRVRAIGQTSESPTRSVQVAAARTRIQLPLILR